VVVLVGIIIGLILTMTRRASAMSDEISKQSRAKFQAIVPTPAGALRNSSQVTEVKEKTQPIGQTDYLRETGGFFTLRKELLETKVQLEQFISDNRHRMEEQRKTLADFEKLRTEVSSLQERLGIDAQEIQNLKSSLVEQDMKLQNQRREIEDQKTLLEKGRDEEIGKLKAEFNVLQEHLLTTNQELQQLKTNLDEQNLKQRSLDSETQRARSVARVQELIEQYKKQSTHKPKSRSATS